MQIFFVQMWENIHYNSASIYKSYVFFMLNFVLFFFIYFYSFFDGSKINKRIASLFSIRYPIQPIDQGIHRLDECRVANELFEWHRTLSFYDLSLNRQWRTWKIGRCPFGNERVLFLYGRNEQEKETKGNSISRLWMSGGCCAYSRSCTNV